MGSLAATTLLAVFVGLVTMFVADFDVDCVGLDDVAASFWLEPYREDGFDDLVTDYTGGLPAGAAR